MIPWYWLIVTAIIAANFGYFLCAVFTISHHEDK